MARLVDLGPSGIWLDREVTEGRGVPRLVGSSRQDLQEFGGAVVDLYSKQRFIKSEVERLELASKTNIDTAVLTQPRTENKMLKILIAFGG